MKRRQSKNYMAARGDFFLAAGCLLIADFLLVQASDKSGMPPAASDGMFS
jgi:hypothetical protein